MTTSKSTHPDVVVVDGSNIATEGRSTPSLTQLNEAVMAFTEEYPQAVVTVVVDATFGHRIDKSEVKEFDAAIAHNELVAPPAGAIGRGDAFVLSIANKVGARILSNDSFQEFHGDYPWLFDEGRLIGGKPVPYVGWVFVDRLPVKGPTSRKAQRASRTTREPKTVRRPASREASQPMPVPTAPPPNVRPAGRSDAPVSSDGPTADAAPAAEVAAKVAPTVTPTAGAAVNDLATFIDFVERHPPGTSVNGVVDSYSSHGAYVRVGELRGYVPLRLMSDPPPRSAREVMRTGDAITLVVSSFAPARRSVDLAVPPMRPEGEAVGAAELEELTEAVEPSRPPATKRATAKRPARKAAATAAEPAEAAATEAAADVVAAQLVTAEAGLATPAVPEAGTPADAAEAAPPPRRTSRTRAARTAAGEPAAAPTAAAPTEPAATKKEPARKAVARTATADKAAPASAKKAAPAKKAATKKAAAAKKAAAEKAAAEKEPAKTASARKAASKKDAAAEKAPTKKASTKKAPEKKAPAKKAAAKAAAKTVAKKAAAKKAAAAKAAAPASS